LLGAQALVEIDSVLLFEVPADQRGVAEQLAIVLDVGDLALWRLRKAHQRLFEREL
jgi:hypothetical protein